MDYEQRAEELFREGYNCAQAVFLAFALEKMDRDEAARLRLSALGAELTLEGEACTSFLQDLLLSLSGPAANLLLAAVLAAVGHFPLFVGANLLLGCFNLLPVCPLDGGCALFALLSCLTSMEWAERVSRLFSQAFSLLVVFCGMLLLLLEHGRPWLLLIGIWLSAASFRPSTP